MKSFRKLSTPILVVVIVVVVLILGAGTAAAASNSLPGSPLYGIQNALDSLKVAAARGDTGKASAHLNIAEQKLEQVQTLVADGKSANLIAEAASQYAQHENAASSEISNAQSKGKDVSSLVTRLSDNSTSQQQVLSGVLSRVPDQAKSAIQKAMTASQKGLNMAIEQQNRVRGAGSAHTATH